MKTGFMILMVALLSSNFSIAHAAVPKFKHVFIVILENANEDEAVAQPFLASLAKRGAYLKSYHGVTQPSQPNYLAMISGDTQGVSGDGIEDLDGKHIGDLLEGAGMSWKVYAEDYPGDCYLKAKSGKYVRKHVPFLSFTNVTNSPERCARIVNADQLDQDVRSGSLPNFAIYVPNMDNDGHDTDVATADAWLKSKFGMRVKSAEFMTDTLFITTFDEGEMLGNSDNQIYASFYGTQVKPGAVATESYDHYNLLRTVEEALGLSTLGQSDAKASPIEGIWK